MKCLFCSGEMEKATVAYTVDRKGYHLFIEKIPAYVCSQCGEKHFEEKEVEAIQNMIKALEEKLQDVLVIMDPENRTAC
ncbi:MAG: YgiT-type zinc finger protein [Thermodesulfovibrionales bacterium]|nr:YgiT-type zinc finger protein [Thermodesulfovibrionales bacterium]